MEHSQMVDKVKEKKLNQESNDAQKKLTKPPHLLDVEKSLNLDVFIRQMQTIVPDFGTVAKNEKVQLSSLSKQQLRGVKNRIYNFSKIKKSKKWLKNILSDKCDLVGNDFEVNGNKFDDYWRDMLRFHNLQKKVKKEINNGLELSQYQNFSSSLLTTSVSNTLHPKNSPSNLSEKRTMNKSHNKKGNKQKSSSFPSVSVFSFDQLPVSSKQININNNKKVVANTNSTNYDEELPILDIASTSSPNYLSSASMINDSKRLKLESNMLDEIPYDTTLPDEILQSESNANTHTHELKSSCVSAVSNETVYNNQLPDEIFYNKNSNLFLSAQSQASKCSSDLSNFTQAKNLTVPYTFTGSRSNSPLLIVNTKAKRTFKNKNSSDCQEASNLKRKRLWTAIARKEIPRAQKQNFTFRKETLANCKKMANWCQREKRKLIIFHQKQCCRDQFSKARRLIKEMLSYWKHFEKVEKDFRKKAEKEAQEQMKIDFEIMEAKRQQRKLNFLITQVELYAHFMSRKISSFEQIKENKTEDEILSQLDEEISAPISHSIKVFDDYNSKEMKEKVLNNVEVAIKAHQKQASTYSENSELAFIETSENKNELLQPRMFEGILKSYQLKGMSWLYYLYINGINGILADEMGLGKTVQTIAFLSLLAEKHSIWGPFLIVAPASTLHNWQQELARFTPKFKLLPYWGNQHDRKVLRKFWSSKYLHRKEASFHILVTSYQLIVQDVKCFQRIKWMYMILDEAQAIKSISSIRWKNLLSFQCRNRLLLSGTPIQNTMAELWALLHFIMPTLFDSHEEFTEWFSKDIECHVENKGSIDEKHLSRLHMILKPFMLRRIKKDVENELSDKIEILLRCELTKRQKLLYQAMKNKISIEELMQTSNNISQAGSSVATSSLMNLVMQFRKICNHPDLLERRDIRTPLFIKLFPFVFPDLLFSEGLIHDSFSFNPTRHKILYNILSVFSAFHIYQEIFNSSSSSCFDFLSLIDFSIQEFRSIIFGDIISWKQIFKNFDKLFKKLNTIIWKKDDTSNRDILLIPTKTTIFAINSNQLINTSNIWQSLLFTLNWNEHFIYTHEIHILHYQPKILKHREIRLKKLCQKKIEENLDLGKNLESKSKKIVKLSRTLVCQPTIMPKFFFVPLIAATNGSKVISIPRDVICYKQRSAHWQHLLKFGGNPFVQRLLNYGAFDSMNFHPHQFLKLQNGFFFPKKLNGLFSLNASNGWSPILIPNKERLVTDSGKLIVLDYILKVLKNEEHRVLIYSQMTKMIDLLEEYMLYRGYIYMRLDGSSRINERRDMVTGFQTRSDIFVFLLSTRAGGLGINLTAADTVIFYDSDWNPTVDQQAMDRAHRLGQTKQVTVYRLICQGTIEERILQKAHEKSEIQRMVISGGNSQFDTLKPNEVVSLLLDDNELERKFKAKQEEKKQLTESDINKTKNKNKSENHSKRKSLKRKLIEESEKEIFSISNLSKTGSNEEANADVFLLSPVSEFSLTSEINQDESNDAVLIDKDSYSTSNYRSTGISTDSFCKTSGFSSNRKKKLLRSRGRPRGSKIGRGPFANQNRNSTASAVASEAGEYSGFQARRNAVFTAYSSLSNEISSSNKKIKGRGRGQVFSFDVNVVNNNASNACKFNETQF